MKETAILVSTPSTRGSFQRAFAAGSSWVVAQEIDSAALAAALLAGEAGHESGQVQRAKIQACLEMQVEVDGSMPRALRCRYPVTIFHLMARRNGGVAAFEKDYKRRPFLIRLGAVEASHAWRVHARALSKDEPNALPI